MAQGRIKSSRGGRSIVITFPQEMFSRLDADATARGISFSRMVNQAVLVYYKGNVRKQTEVSEASHAK